MPADFFADKNNGLSASLLKQNILPIFLQSQIFQVFPKINNSVDHQYLPHSSLCHTLKNSSKLILIYGTGTRLKKKHIGHFKHVHCHVQCPIRSISTERKNRKMRFHLCLRISMHIPCSFSFRVGQSFILPWPSTTYFIQ